MLCSMLGFLHCDVGLIYFSGLFRPQMDSNLLSYVRAHPRSEGLFNQALQGHWKKGFKTLAVHMLDGSNYPVGIYMFISSVHYIL